MDTDQPGQPGARNFSVGYGNGLGPAPARPADPASRPTAVTGLRADLPADLSAPVPLPAPSADGDPAGDDRRRRGVVLFAVLAAGLFVAVAAGGIVLSRRANQIELGADHPGGVDTEAQAGAEALGSNVITLDGGGTRGTIVLDDGSVMIVLDDGSLAEPNPDDPDHPIPTTTSTAGATTPATDAAGHPVTTTGDPSHPTGATTPTTSGVTVPTGPGPTVSIPTPTIPLTVPPTVPGVTVTVTTPPVTDTTPATVPEVTSPPTLGEPPQSVPNTFVTTPPIKLYPQITEFTGPKSAGCSTLFKGSKTITLSWTTKFTKSVTMSMDGRGAVTLDANGSVNLTFNCATSSHTFTLRAVNSAGTSAPVDRTVNR